MISTVLEDPDFDESNFDSDLEAFQFIHEESIKDENIANIIQDLMSMEHDETDISTNQELHFKPLDIADIKNIPDPEKHILISSKPNKIKLAPTVPTSKNAKTNPSPPKHQSSKPSLVSTLESPAKGIKMKINKCKELTNGSGMFKPGKLVLTEKVNLFPNSIKTEKEFREPAIPAHRTGVPGKQAAKVATSSNVYLERNKENAQHQNVKIVKRSKDLQIAQKAVGKAAKKRPPPSSTAQLQQETTLIVQQNQPQMVQNPQNTTKEPVLEERLLGGQCDNGLDPSNAFIGDWKRMFVTFDNLEENSVNSVDYRAERFMNNLDSWGITPEVPRPVFDGFSLDSDPMDYIGQEVPEDWKDDSVFSELDRMAVSENVFLHKWLPKCALRMRVNPYRKMLRALNEKDPYFNIMLA